MKWKREIKFWLRPMRDIALIMLSYIYDIYRYIRYSGYYGYIKDDAKRDYKAVKIYHRLEKSLSFRDRKCGAGRGAVDDLLELLSKRPKTSKFGFHESIALNVLDAFSKESGINYASQTLPCENRADIERGGVMNLSSSHLRLGVLDDPEIFFFSRYSVRDFSEARVDKALVERAVRLALKTPSVCNRQGWGVYHTNDRKIIDLCLSFQNGNKGFGHEIPSLIIIAADLKAFDTAGERNQCWVDAGMFSMSLIYALHSLGVSSCCLNWSKTPFDDIRIRKVVPIKPHHNIVMMLGIGYPKENIKVCVSARRPLASVYEYWGK